MRRRAPVALSLAAVICGGCGSSSTSSARGSGSRSGSFVSQANAVCSSAAAQLAKANPKDSLPYMALLGRITNRLAAVHAPKADQPPLSAYVSDLRATTRGLGDLYDASKAGDRAKMTRLIAQLSSLEQDRNKAAAALAALGPKNCGSGPSGSVS